MATHLSSLPVALGPGVGLEVVCFSLLLLLWECGGGRGVGMGQFPSGMFPPHACSLLPAGGSPCGGEDGEGEHALIGMAKSREVLSPRGGAASLTDAESPPISSLNRGPLAWWAALLQGLGGYQQGGLSHYLLLCPLTHVRCVCTSPAAPPSAPLLRSPFPAQQVQGGSTHLLPGKMTSGQSQSEVLGSSPGRLSQPLSLLELPVLPQV